MNSSVNTKPDILAGPVTHRGEKRIKLVFDYNLGLIKKVKQIQGSRWSKTMGCWHVPFTVENKKKLTEQLGENNLKFREEQPESFRNNINTVPRYKEVINCNISKGEGIIYFTSPYYKKDEVKKMEGIWWHPGAKKWSAHDTEDNMRLLKDIFSSDKFDVLINEEEKRNKAKQTAKKEKLVNIVEETFFREMHLRNYSEKTIELYQEHINRFLYKFKGRDIGVLDGEEIKKYIYDILTMFGHSYNYQNQFISALKKYYELVFGRILTGLELPRPKRRRDLPKVISKEDVLQMIPVTTNLKHQLILCLLYGCGLRRNEVINIKVFDVDLKNKTLMVLGKGNKYRMLPLGIKLVTLLETYLKSYLPKTYLLNGQNSVKYSCKSVENIVINQAKKARIKKHITPHTLRHCFATHHLENGVDIRIIQELLGHRSSKTTEIYTYVSRKNIKGVHNLLD